MSASPKSFHAHYLPTALLNTDLPIFEAPGDMRHSPPPALIAPSVPLLRFLRQQASDLACFTPNARHLDSQPRRALPCRGSRQRRPRHFSTASPAALEASLLPIGPPFRSREYRPSTLFSSVQTLPNGPRAPRLPHCRAISEESDARGPWWQQFTSRVQQFRGRSGHWPRCDDKAGLFDNDGLALFDRVKTPNEPMLRCTELDENGKVTVVDGQFKKTEIISRFGLLPRDLRKIDSSMLPSIIARPSVILINLVHLRMLVRHDRVLLIDSYGAGRDKVAQSMFMYNLQGKLAQREPTTARAVPGGPLPYEFRALEAVLVNVTGWLEIEFEQVRGPVVRVLDALEGDIHREKLRHLLVHSKRLGAFEQTARLVRDAIEGLLEDDDDLSTMYLSETAQGRKREPEDHSEIEMLLESYHKVTDEIVESSATLISEIRNTEEIVKAILDANRNALMLLDLKFSIGTLGIGTGAFVAALYGMNLKNFIEESDVGFWGVSGVSAALAAVVLVYGLHKLRKVQRVRMWGEGGDSASLAGHGRLGGWKDGDPRNRLRLDAAHQERARRLKEGRREGWRTGGMKSMVEVPPIAPGRG